MPKPTARFIKEQVNTDMRFQTGKPKPQPVSAAFLSALVQSLAHPRWDLAAGCSQGWAALLRTLALLPTLPPKPRGDSDEIPFPLKGVQCQTLGWQQALASHGNHFSTCSRPHNTLLVRHRCP